MSHLAGRPSSHRARAAVRLVRVLGLVAPAALVAGLLVSGGPGPTTSTEVDSAQLELAGAQKLLPSRPSPRTTGVPKGLKLRKHRGDIVVTKAGTRIDKMDVRGFIIVKAPNVRITRSIVRGGVARHNIGLITNYGSRNLVIKDVTLKPRRKSVYVDGIKGWNFTAKRVHVIGGVDSIKVQGGNVRIVHSLLENTTWFAKDPSQGGGPTHNDNIQIQTGSNITVARNTIRGSQNFAILGAAAIGNTSGLVVRDNWVDGGHCTVKLQTHKSYQLRVAIRGNVFGPNRKVRSCPLVASSNAAVSSTRNVFDNGAPVRLQRWDD